MPPILDRLFGRGKKEEEKKAPQRVSEEAARKRREELARKQKEAEEARKRFEKREEERKKKAAEEPAKAAAKKIIQVYIVKSGDSLSKIAKELYGDASRWPDIYEANKELIGDNPNLIHPGQKLNIPE